MPFGINQELVWNPPPGWTGNPFPETFTVVNGWNWEQLAIAQTTPIQIQLLAFQEEIGNIGKVVLELRQLTRSLTSTVDSAKTAIVAMPTITAQRNMIQVSLAASQIKTNNFYAAVTTDKPVMPSQKEQMTESVKESFKLMESAYSQGSIVAQVNSMASSFSTYVTVLMAPMKTAVLDFIGLSAEAAVLPDYTPLSAEDNILWTALELGMPYTAFE